MKNKYNFTLVEPKVTIKHEGFELMQAVGSRGAELWVGMNYFGSCACDVYNKDLKKIAYVESPLDINSSAYR